MTRPNSLSFAPHDTRTDHSGDIIISWKPGRQLLPVADIKLLCRAKAMLQITTAILFANPPLQLRVITNVAAGIHLASVSRPAAVPSGEVTHIRHRILATGRP
jgi:hypothetical protein